MEKTATVKPEEKETNVVKKVFSIIGNVLFYIFIIVLLLFAIANLVGKDKKVPSLFGRYYISVVSGSMTGPNKDSFNEGDMIIDKIATDDLVKNLTKGQVITFNDSSLKDKANQLNSHRIVDIIYMEDGKTIDHFICQGDYVITDHSDYIYDADKYATDNVMQSFCQEVYPEDVVGIYETKIPKFGSAIVFLRSQLGFGLCIVLPTAVLLILEGFFLVKNILTYNKQKMEAQQAVVAEQQKADLEAERERMKAELMAELKKEQENQAHSDDSSESEEKKDE